MLNKIKIVLKKFSMYELNQKKTKKLKMEK